MGSPNGDPQETLATAPCRACESANTATNAAPPLTVCPSVNTLARKKQTKTNTRRRRSRASISRSYDARKKAYDGQRRDCRSCNCCLEREEGQVSPPPLTFFRIPRQRSQGADIFVVAVEMIARGNDTQPGKTSVSLDQAKTRFRKGGDRSACRAVDPEEAKQQPRQQQQQRPSSTGPGINSCERSGTANIYVDM